MRFYTAFIILLITLAFGACTVYRGVLYGGPKIHRYDIYPSDTVHKGTVAFHFAEQDSAMRVFDTLKLEQDICGFTLSQRMEKGGAGSFLIIQNDTIKYENYFHGFDRSTPSLIFSVSKSIASLLCGIAIDQGYIKSIEDPVVDYLPELKKRDPRFGRLTIEHLLDMRTGLKFNENYGWNPFARIARLHYGTNLLRQIESLRFECEPGTKHRYQSIATVILGIVIERATGKKFAQYLEETVWQPLGMQYDALIGLDDKRHRYAKAYGGLVTNAIDLAKIGRLYLNKGNWEGRQIVDSAWIARSAIPDINNDGYQNCWYSMQAHIAHPDGNRIFADSASVVEKFCKLEIPPGRRRILHDAQGWRGICCYESYYASGLWGQFLFVSPKNGMIIVRLGEKYPDNYLSLINNIANRWWREGW